MKASMTVHSSAAKWHELRHFAEAFARAHRLTRNDTGRLLIVLEELLTNLVKYGYEAGQPTGSARVELIAEDGDLTIVFEDDGRPFDPLAMAEPALDDDLEDRPIGGLGIYLLRTFSDSASYARENGRNRLRLTRRLETAGGGKPV